MAAIRSMVTSKSKPWNIPLWMWSRFGSSMSPGCVDLHPSISSGDSTCFGEVYFSCRYHHARRGSRRCRMPGRRPSSVGCRLDHVHHQPDDVPRRAELPVDAGGGELAEQILVEVALGVARSAGARSIMSPPRPEGWASESSAGRLSCTRPNVVAAPAAAGGSAGIPCPGRAAASLAASCAECDQRSSCSSGLKTPGNGFPGFSRRDFRSSCLPDIEQPGEHQEGNLLDDGQRVGDPARPELLPELVDWRLKLSRNHSVASRVVVAGRSAWAEKALMTTSSSSTSLLVEDTVEAVGCPA